MIQRQGEAIVLRTWPFLEADLLVSLFTREHGRIKGVARHALRSRRRFGGALEPMTVVRATWAERPRAAAIYATDTLVRLDAFEIISSPLSRPIDYSRTVALQLVAEVLEHALPEQAPDDPIYRLALTVVDQLQTGSIWLPVTYFALWMSRLQGWMPLLGQCLHCGNATGGQPVWYSATADGVQCADCADSRRADPYAGSTRLSAQAVQAARGIFTGTLRDLAAEPWPATRHADLRRFAIELLERHLEHRLASARALNRL